MSAKKANRITNDDRSVEEAGWWHSHGYSHKEITAIMGFDKVSTARRLVEKSQFQQLVETRFISQKVTPERYAELKHMCPVSDALFQRLAESSKKGSDAIFQRITVFNTGVRGNSEEAAEQRTAQIANFAGEQLKEWLAECALVGVSWGRTLELTFKAIRDRIEQKTIGGRRALEVIPTLGETLKLREDGQSSSQLAAALHLALGGKSK